MRKIIHIDMDMFFAAVEMRDHPEYRGIPLAVGGAPSRRGIISTANYKARKYGVHSGLASSIAVRRCPDLLIVPGRYDTYKEVSYQVMEILSEYSDKVSIMGLDEAYIDVTESELFYGSATWMAMDMKRRIFEATGLTASAGVAPNMFLAKVASDWNKPNGIKVVTPEQVQDFVQNLDLCLIPGVGKKATAKLAELGLVKCRDILATNPLTLSNLLGSWGLHLRELAQGIDQREVGLKSERKSLSTEHTYAQDISDLSQMKISLDDLCDDLLYRLSRYKEKRGERELQTLGVKVKFHNFKRVTAEKSFPSEILASLWKTNQFDQTLKEELYRLLEEAYQRESIPIRLLGLGIRFRDQGTKGESDSERGGPVQLDLFSHAE